MTQPTFKQTAFTLFILIVLLLSLHETSFAHRIRVFAYSSGPDIIVEGSFGKNRPAINSQITIFAASTGKQIMEGQTDNQGIFQLPKPQLAVDEGLRIVLVGGQGHQAEWFLTPEDIGESLKKTTPVTPPKQRAQQPDKPTLPPTTAHPEQSEQLQQLIEQVVAKEIAPLKKMLVEQLNSGPSFQEIIGGIGWIVGLAGLISLFKSKKTSPQEKS